MKLNKQAVILLVLISLLLSSIGTAFYFYKHNKKSFKSNNTLVVVYVASKDIKKGQQITQEYIKKISIAKQYVLSTPLIDKEIVNKFAKENIYKDDMFRKEKIATTLDGLLDVVSNFKFNSYNISFELFQNPNYSLKKGDFINIVSVYPSSKSNNTTPQYLVQYVAKQVEVLGFLIDGKETDITIKKMKVTKKIKSKDVVQEVDVKAEEMILDIDSKVLLSLIKDYNRGNQLWMVKTHPNKNAMTKKVQIESRNYPVTLYRALDKRSTLKATIRYGNEQQASVVKNKTSMIDKKLQCQNASEYIIGSIDNVLIRKGPNIHYKIVRRVNRNYIIPHLGKVDDSWYRTCDGYYVHEIAVTPISKELAMKKLGHL